MTSEDLARVYEMEIEVAHMARREPDPQWRGILERLRDSFGPVVIGPEKHIHHVPEPKEGPWKTT